MTNGGVLGQWIQLYELDDDLFLSILAALDQVFPSYRGYLVGRADVAIVAGMGPDLPDPDWTVLDLDGIRRTMLGAPPFTAAQMQALTLFDETTFRSVLDRSIEPNSDYHPILDLGAERARFEGASAEGLLSFASSRVDVRRNLIGERTAPAPFAPVPARGLSPLVGAGRAAWLRQNAHDGADAANTDFVDWTASLRHLRKFLEETAAEESPESWRQFAQDFSRAEGESHWGTVGWGDEDFYQATFDYLDRANAPVEARAVVDLMYGTATWDWARAASAADILIPTMGGGESWASPTVLLDASVVAYLNAGRPEAAREAFTVLRPHTDRATSNLRNRLLDALIGEAMAAPAEG